MTRAAVRLQRGEPESLLYKALHRVADRLSPRIKEAFLDAVEGAFGEIDLRELTRAVRTGTDQAVLRAVGADRFRLALRDASLAPVRDTVSSGAQAVAEAVRQELGGPFAFEVGNPNFFIAAQRNVATMVSRVDSETKNAIRGIIDRGLREGTNPRRTAVHIRDVVGMREDYAQAVVNFRGQLEEMRGLSATEAERLARKATDRRLDAVTKGRIRKLAREGRLTEEAVDEFTDTYRRSLLNRRAIDIGRTESIGAVHDGQQEIWREATKRGVFDEKDVRRFWIVTPDDRLRPSHAAIPGLNPDGVRLEEPFTMPDGSTAMRPPPGFSPWNCRCSVSLSFIGQPGVL